MHNFKVDKKLILGVLNSKLMSYFYAKKYFASHLQGGAFGFDTLSVGSLPIPKINSTNQATANQIIALVDEILTLKKCCHSKRSEESHSNKDISASIKPQYDNKDSAFDTSALESQIDNLVYKLYNLSENEIRIIEQ